MLTIYYMTMLYVLYTSYPIKILTTGVPVVVQWKQTQLVSMRMHLRSLASFS